MTSGNQQSGGLLSGPYSPWTARIVQLQNLAAVGNLGGCGRQIANQIISSQCKPWDTSRLLYTSYHKRSEKKGESNGGHGQAARGRELHASVLVG